MAMPRGSTPTSMALPERHRRVGGEVDDAHGAVDGTGDVGAAVVGRDGHEARLAGPPALRASNCAASLPSVLRTRITETLAFWRFTTTARLSSLVSAMLLERDWRNSSW